MKSYSAIAFASFVSSVAAHGYVTSPQPRLPGNGLKTNCGDQVFNNQNSDHYGNVQGSIQNLQGSHPDCRIWQCKGIPFSDASQVFSYTAGQVIPMTVDIRAPHSGVANVSIVKTSTDKIIGTPLKSWDQYALTSSPMSQHPDWTSFSITMPDVSSECATAGDCVIQWWWDAASINQSYESCIDFTMGGSGSGSATTPATPKQSKAATTPTTPSAAPQASKPASSQPTIPSAAPQASKPASTQPTTCGSSYPDKPQPSVITAGQGGSATTPKTFTVDTFIAWLRENAGSDVANMIKRTIAAERDHARAFAM